MNQLKKLLQQKKVLVSDGAWGTMLFSKGLTPGACPEEWNVSHPEIVATIPRAYLETGVDIILSNSFGGSPFKLAQYGLEERAAELNFAAAKISTDLAQGSALVFGSVGPTGRFLEPLGTTTEPEMIENFKIQIKALADGGVDAILIETMSDLQEVGCAITASREVCDLPIIASLTFEKGKQGYKTMMGVSVAAAVETLSQMAVDVIGSNCGNGIEQIVEIIAEIRRQSDKFLLARPNAGLPKLVNGVTVFEQTAEQMAQHVPALIHAGANIIGGCCGTTPEHIRAMIKKVRALI